MRYIIIEKRNVQELETEIENRLYDGYSCQGGICVSSQDGFIWYTQAMTKGE
jgi:hypothetical protein